MSKQQETNARVLVWKNLRLIVKNAPKPVEQNTNALLVLVNANNGEQPT